MLKRRVLSCVLSAFIICGIIFGPTSVSATYNTLDDLEIDPWGDLEDIQGFEPPTPELVPDDFEPITMYPDMDVFSFNGYNAYTLVNSADLRFGYSDTTSSAAVSTVFGADLEYQIPAGENFYDFYQSSTRTYDSFTFAHAPMTVTATNPTVYDEGEYSLSGRLGFWFLLNRYLSNGTGGTVMQRSYPTSFNILNNGSVIFSGNFNENGTYVFDNEVIKIAEKAPLTLEFVFPQYSYSSNFEKVGLCYAVVRSTLQDSVTLTYTDKTLGLLDGIIGWLQDILNGILELPQNIANLILEGLQGLFIPDQEELTELMDKYNALFEERLGFIYQMFTFVVDSFTTWVETMKAAQDYSFTFPGISFPYNGDVIEIVPEQEVSLDNAVMDVLRPVLGTIVSIVCVLAFTNTCFDLVIALMSGQSYLEFLGRKREEWDE